MSWLSDQLANSIKPSLQTLQDTQASLGGFTGAGASTSQTASQAAQNTSNQASYMSGGQDAFNQYLDALGMSYQTKAATATTPGGSQSLNNSHWINNGQDYYIPGTTINNGNAAQYTTGLGDWAGNGTLYSKAGMTPDQGTATQQAMTNMTPSQKQSYLASNGFQRVYTNAADAQSSGTPSQAAQYSTPSSAQSIIDRFTSAPGYQAALAQGLGTINANASTAGLLGSGAQAKALQRYGSDYASQGYQQYLGNFLNAANLGQQAATAVGNQNTSLQNALTGANSASQTALINAQTKLGEDQAKLQAGNRTVGNTALLGMGASSF